MTQRTFELVTATNMFMHGADRRSVELRPPALKGVMRYWFRALVGGLTDLGGLKDAEARVFGAADQNVGQRLIVRVAPLVTGDRRSPLLPHKSGRDASESAAIADGTRFTVRLVVVGSGGLPPAQRLGLASWSLWLAACLGGFGQRARRGAGSVRMAKIDPVLADAPEQLGNSALQRKGTLETGLNHAIAYARSALRGDAARTRSGGFPILAKDVARIVVGRLAASTEVEARKRVMELRGRADPSHGDRAFGGIRQSRLASPVHVHLEPEDKGSFLAVVTWFREPSHGQPRLVERFLDEIKGSDGQEVTLP